VVQLAELVADSRCDRRGKECGPGQCLRPLHSSGQAVAHVSADVGSLHEFKCRGRNTGLHDANNAVQHTPAGRAAQLTGRQPALDSIDICFYGDHYASDREQTALP